MLTRSKEMAWDGAKRQGEARIFSCVMSNVAVMEPFNHENPETEGRFSKAP